VLERIADLLLLQPLEAGTLALLAALAVLALGAGPPGPVQLAVPLAVPRADDPLLRARRGSRRQTA
jgi:hypothetical protein